MTVVPDALDALVAGFTVAVPSGVTVIDGPPWDPPTDDFLCVAHGGDIEQPGVLVDAPIDAYGGSQAENFDVLCYLTSFIDDEGTIASTRRRALVIYAACAAWLAGDQFLGGLVADARVRPGYTVQVVQSDEAGTGVAVQFTVAVTSST